MFLLNDSLRKEKNRLVRRFIYREDRIRTCDTLVPNQVLYQAELLPVMQAVGFEPTTV